MLELSLLRHFLAVGRTCSFTRAARELHTSQPVITRSIQRLEDLVGTCLVERTTRSVLLTTAGRALLRDAEFLLDRAAVAMENTRRIGQGGHGRMRIGICPTTESHEIARGIAAFRAKWPDIELHFASIDSAEQPGALRASDIDVGIMQNDGLWQEGITGTVITTYGLVVAVPASWGYDEGTAIRLIDLKDRPWLMPDRQRAEVWHDSLMAMCSQAGFEPRIVGTVNDVVSARMLIASGAGATFFHDTGRRESHGAIAYLHFSDPQIPPPSRTAAACAAGANSPLIAEFIACMATAHANSAGAVPAVNSQHQDRAA
jgi:DNA-binding transcriptional LysR family regulator